MYTQCPDCSTAFRVTADVLKQAAGKVRCGGCGNAFNALAYLSEAMPQQAAPTEADAALPELTPEVSNKSNGLPETISAEQSAALLKTLDELAGSDIRIEDTGVEWRVLDDENIGTAASDPVANEASAGAPPASAPSTPIDEVLEDSPTPVDQFLTETPPQVESPEIFEDAVDEPSRTSVDELRFDDNTPLPDDFDLDDESLFAPTPQQAAAEPKDDIDEDVEEDPQADFDLSEPDEWTDILDEFEGIAEAVAASAEPDALPAATAPPLATELDLLQELETAAIEDENTAAIEDKPLDMDSQFALQAEAMGIDLSGLQEALDEDEVKEDVDLELLLENGDNEDQDIEDLLDEDVVEELDEDEVVAHLDEDFEDELDDEKLDIEDDDEQEPEEDLEDAQLDLMVDESDEDLEDGLEEEPEDHLEDGALDDEEIEDEEPEDEELEDEVIEVPPLTEEEQTINMQIDQDLLALAIEDEDGFASTIVIPDDAIEGKAVAEKPAKIGEINLKDTAAGFETIVMEGESVRSKDDTSKQEADVAAAALLTGAAAAEREAAAAALANKRSTGMMVGMIALVLVLTVQVLHQSREALATNPTFNEIASPIYRAIGMPLSPDWNIKSWRFEATQLSVDDSADSESPDGIKDVTIVSRLGNNSDESLPYPIIGIFQTDRYEEPIGSFTLDPVDYLPNNLDPRKLVDPGRSFTAVMTVRSPSIEDTSFRLRACYRNADGSLRCKDDSFKK